MLLDHGLYVDLPDSLRENYCALWWSFLVSDMTTATYVSEQLAGMLTLLNLFQKVFTRSNPSLVQGCLAEPRS